MKMKKFLSAALSAAMLVSLLAACGGSSSDSSSVSEASAVSVSEAPATQEAAATSAAPKEASAVEEASIDESSAAEETIDTSALLYTFPLEEEATLTAWAMWIPGIEQYVDSPMDTQVFQEMKKLTNVSLEMTLASSPETAMTEFNLLIASGDYPDLLNNFSGYYSAGVDSGIENEVIYDIYDYEDQLPHYFAKLRERDALEDATSAEGHMGAVYQLSSSADTAAESGLVLRQDWMEELGAEAPKTYDDLHDLLLEMKDKYSLTEALFVPKTGIPDSMMDGLDTGMDYILNNEMGSAPWNYIDNGSGLDVVFGFEDDSFYDVLELMSTWREDGLFNADYLNHNYNIDPGDLTEGTSGAYYATEQTINAGNTFQPHMYKAYPNVSIDGNPIRKVKEVQSPISAQGYSISQNCENPDLAADYLDYQYADETYILNNYGVEGISFNYDENGDPVLSDLIMNNPDGIAQAYTQFIYLSVTGSFYCDGDRFKSNYTEEAKECVAVWESAYDFEESPYNTRDIQLTTEEREQYSQTFSDISTYLNEMISSFILGQTELNEDTFAEFKSHMEEMGLTTCRDIMQAAADRYVASLNEA